MGKGDQTHTWLRLHACRVAQAVGTATAHHHATRRLHNRQKITKTYPINPRPLFPFFLPDFGTRKRPMLV